MKKCSMGLLFLLVIAVSAYAVGDTVALPKYRWMKKMASFDTLQERISPPDGYSREELKPRSFANWLRHMPLKPKGAPVMLYDGTEKHRQDVHQAVFNIDTGKRDRQQCADAVMRLRAEFLHSRGRAQEVCFKAVSGKKMCWKDNKKIGFRRYLSNVFAFANTRSLFHQMKKVADLTNISAGEVFIEPATGGAYGHAVIVMDVAVNKKGEKLFLLAQSYMPAQDIHLLKNMADPSLSPWYRLEPDEILVTPEWQFDATARRRF